PRYFHTLSLHDALPILWLRRMLIAAIFLGGYLFYWILDNRYSLTNLALLAFIETLQFLPGTFAIMFWTKGNRRGMLAGLAAGTLIWAGGLLVPVLWRLETLTLPFIAVVIPVGIERWSDVTLLSLGVNTLTFIIISPATRQTEDELSSADLCAADELSHPVRQALDVHSALEFKTRLAKPLGKVTASREVDIALHELNLNIDERRPYALRRLRDQIEGNLSSLMGIHVASEIMDKYIPHVLAENQSTVDINLIENRLAEYRDHLTGMAAELNTLRLYHRKTLEELPMAVCSLGRDMEVLMWNRAMANLTQIPTEDVTGSYLEDIPEPWCSLLIDFSQSKEPHFYRREIELNSRPHWISLHKANIEGTITAGVYDQVMLLEDVTETQLLEQELVHSEIGRAYV